MTRNRRLLLLAVLSLLGGYLMHLGSGADARPSVSIADGSLDLGRLWAGSPVNHSFVLSNEGKQPARVIRILAPCRCIRFQELPMSLEPGEWKSVTATINPPLEFASDGRLTTGLELFVSGYQPTRRFTARATVQLPFTSSDDVMYVQRGIDNTDVGGWATVTKAHGIASLDFRVSNPSLTVESSQSQPGTSHFSIRIRSTEKTVVIPGLQTTRLLVTPWTAEGEKLPEYAIAVSFAHFTSLRASEDSLLFGAVELGTEAFRSMTISAPLDVMSTMTADCPNSSVSVKLTEIRSSETRGERTTDLSVTVDLKVSVRPVRSGDSNSKISIAFTESDSEIIFTIPVHWFGM